MKVYVEGVDKSIYDMFISRGWEITYFIREADLVCFEGGADVDPLLYGEKNTHSYVSEEADYESLILFTLANRYEVPMVGICRGGQFLNVMAGGSMIQHIEGHGVNHMIYSCYGSADEEVLVTSSHHQAMIPGDNSEVLFKSKDGINEIILHDVHKGWFQTPMLSFQPHPEYGGKHDTEELFFRLINDELGLST